MYRNPIAIYALFGLGSSSPPSSCEIEKYFMYTSWNLVKHLQQTYVQLGDLKLSHTMEFVTT